MRAHAFLAALCVFAFPFESHADRPDGLDCGSYPAIPEQRCNEWKQRNAEGRLWCRWNHSTGAMRASFGAPGKPINPGLDLTKITRQSARSDTATRELLEAYSRQHIREIESLLGFRPNGYELKLTDLPAPTSRGAPNSSSGRKFRHPANLRRLDDPSAAIRQAAATRGRDLRTASG